MYRFGGADLLSHSGASGGLDARLGATSKWPTGEAYCTVFVVWTEIVTIATLHLGRSRPPWGLERPALPYAPTIGARTVRAP